MLKAVVFDLDDTLYPEWTFVKSGCDAVGEWCRKELGLEEFAATAFRVYQSGVRGRIFNRTLELLQISYDAALIDKLVTVYREHRPRLALFDDARMVLTRLQRQYRLGLITDGAYQVQQHKIDALAIASCFDIMVLTDRYGRSCWKPAQFAYQKVMETLGYLGRECVYIGDNPQKDFITAKGLGWRTIRIRRVDTEYAELTMDPDHEAEVELTSLEKVPEIIIRF
ncbi:MAG TPA: HAD family hydrolase [Bacillota bacterium]